MQLAPSPQQERAVGNILEQPVAELVAPLLPPGHGFDEPAALRLQQGRLHVSVRVHQLEQDGQGELPAEDARRLEQVARRLGEAVQASQEGRVERSGNVGLVGAGQGPAVVAAHQRAALQQAAATSSRNSGLPSPRSSSSAAASGVTAPPSSRTTSRWLASRESGPSASSVKRWGSSRAACSCSRAQGASESGRSV